MLIEIDRLPQEGLKVSKKYEFISAELLEEDAEFLNPVHTDVFIKKSGDEIFLTGVIKTCISLICCRCLSSFDFKIDSRFDLVYLPEEVDINNEQLDEEEAKKLFYYGRKMDLKRIIMEQLNFALPVRPLCSPDCQGICPVCGNIVKEGKCSCVVNETDPRLDKFKIFPRDKR